MTCFSLLFFLDRAIIPEESPLPTRTLYLAQAETDETAAPWERVSAAIGITDYDRKNDRTVKTVMERGEDYAGRQAEDEEG